MKKFLFVFSLVVSGLALAGAVSVAPDCKSNCVFTGQVKHDDGTAALPSIAFSGNTGTGFSRRAGEALDWSISGVRRGVVADDRFQLGSGTLLGWSSVPTAEVAADVLFQRISAGVLGVTGDVRWMSDNAYDIGTVGVNRPRNLYLAGSMLSGTVPTGRLAAEVACAVGYTDVRGWCMDTDGDSVLLRSTTVGDVSYQTVFVGTNYKIALIHLVANAIQDATGEASLSSACVLPGDSALTSCNPSLAPSISKVVARANLANEEQEDHAEYLVRLDNLGQIKTRCTVSNTLAAASCLWYLVGYLP